MEVKYSESQLIDAIVETSCQWRRKVESLGREGVLTAEQVATILDRGRSPDNPLKAARDAGAGGTNGASDAAA